MRKFLCEISRMIQSYAKIVRVVRIQTWQATEACWHTSLAMFCGLASRLAQSLAPKHAVSPVAAHEPQATVDMHADLPQGHTWHDGLRKLLQQPAARPEKQCCSQREHFEQVRNTCVCTTLAKSCRIPANFALLISCLFSGFHVSMEMRRCHQSGGMLLMLRVECHPF